MASFANPTDGPTTGAPADPEQGTIHTENGQQYIMIGRSKVHINDVMSAFGGSLNPGLSAPSDIKIANPSPIGLCGFAMTTFLDSIINFKGRGITIPNAVVGLAYFHGGMGQFIAGLFEIVAGNTFGATALAGFGSFWLSWAAMNTPSFGVAEAYASEPRQLENATGFFLLGWSIFTWGLVLCTLKSTVALFSLFFFLALTFLLLAIGNFVPSKGCVKAGGVVGLITSCIAWYNAFVGVANRENSYVTAHPIYLPGGRLNQIRYKSKPN